MRMALINENADLAYKYPNYVVKMTGDDEIGKQELDNFMDVEERFPVLATTSKMLTTGVDTKMVKLIVLDANIGSMTEFKQIIGRGTRIREEEGKVYFTVMDFRKATNHFADPDFDGDPVQIYEPQPDESIVPPDNEVDESIESTDVLDEEDLEFVPPNVNIDETEEDKPKKYYVNNIEVSVANERVQYYGSDGKLITESLRDYSRNNIVNQFSSLDNFLQKWSVTDKKAAIIEALTDQGVLLEHLKEEVGKDLDIFDLICHIAFDQPPLTRKERADNVRKQNYFGQYSETAQKVIEALLTKYENEGITAIEDTAVLNIKPLNTIGSPVELVRAFGKKKDFEKAVKDLETQIYGKIG